MDNGAQDNQRLTKNRFADLVRIKKHPDYWINPESGFIYWRGSIFGHRIKKSTHCKKISEAKLFMQKYFSEVNEEDLKQKRENRGVKNPLIADVWPDLMNERANRSTSTKQSYKTSWEHKLKPFWGSKHVSDINRKSIIEFENWFLDKFEGMSFFNVRKHLKMLIRYLFRERYIKKQYEVSNLDNEVIDARSKKKKHSRVYTDLEKKALIEFAVTQRARVCLILYFDTGMRKMELLSAKVNDFNIADKTLDVWSSKNKNWRTIPLTDIAFNELIKWTKGLKRKSEYLFPQSNNPKKHIIGQYFDKDWVKTKKLACIIGKARVHDIRHTFATKTALDSWPIIIVTSILDMSVKEYVRTYTHIDASDAKRILLKSFNP